MMRAHLATPTFDLQGAVELELNASNRPLGASRRVNRVATLDGGVAINDFGSSYADTTHTLVWATGPVDKAVDRLVRLYARLWLFTSEGAFLVAPELLETTNGEARLRLLTIERLDV